MSGFTFPKESRNYKRSLSEVKEFSSNEDFVQYCNGTRVIKKVRIININLKIDLS